MVFNGGVCNNSFIIHLHRISGGKKLPVSGVKVHLDFPLAIAHTWHSREKLQLGMELRY